MLSENQKKIKKLYAQMEGKTIYRKKFFNDIYRNPLRIDRPNGNETKTMEKQFVYENNRFVEPCLDYHKVYTKNFKEYCFLGAGRQEKDVLIRPKIRSDFQKYSSFTTPSLLNIKSEFEGPKQDDYRKRFFTRYFAQKANEPKSTPFEISKEQFDTSPLYIYAKCNWMISGRNINIIRKL